MDSSFNSISLMRFAATITEIAGCEKPRCADKPLDWVVSAVNDIVKNGIDRIVIHNPDAIALWLFNAYRDKFTPVLAKTQLTVPFSVVMPSCTPVCFANNCTPAPCRGSRDTEIRKTGVKRTPSMTPSSGLEKNAQSSR